MDPKILEEIKRYVEELKAQKDTAKSLIEFLEDIGEPVSEYKVTLKDIVERLKRYEMAIKKQEEKLKEEKE